VQRAQQVALPGLVLVGDAIASEELVETDGAAVDQGSFSDQRLDTKEEIE